MSLWVSFGLVLLLHQRDEMHLKSIVAGGQLVQRLVQLLVLFLRAC